QPTAGPLEPGDEPRNPEPGTSRRALHGQGQVLVGIDGETARLYLVDTGAGDELAELVHLPLLIGDAGEREQVQRRVDTAPAGEADRLLHFLPAVLDRLVIRFVQRLVRAVQADPARVEAGVDQQGEVPWQGAVGVDVDRSSRRRLPHLADRFRDLPGARQRLALASLPHGPHRPSEERRVGKEWRSRGWQES